MDDTSIEKTQMEAEGTDMELGMGIEPSRVGDKTRGFGV